MKSTYVKICESNYPLFVTRKARNNAALNFLDNICFVLEANEKRIQKDKPLWLRNSAFDYDLRLLFSSETEELVLLDFTDVEERRRVDIDFSLLQVA